MNSATPDTSLKKHTHIRGFVDWLPKNMSISYDDSSILLPAWVDFGTGYYSHNCLLTPRQLARYGIEHTLWYAANYQQAIVATRKYKNKSTTSIVAPCLEHNQLQDLASLQQHGVGMVWISEHHLNMPDRLLNALRIAKAHNMMTIATPNLKMFAPHAQVHAGGEAIAMGLIGHPPIAERTAIHLLIELAIESRAHIHINGISCGQSVPIIASAKANHAPISADVGIDNLIYTCRNIQGFATQFKLWPPLRDESDRSQLRQGVIDGVIDGITTRHIAVEYPSKNCPFVEAVFGRATYPHLAAMLLELHENGMSWRTIAHAIHANPASILGITEQTENGSFMVIDSTTRKVVLFRNK